MDMSPNGSGEWKQWNNVSFFGAPFVWTTVHNFGGTNGMKGDFSVVNRIPFDGMSTSSVFGMGATPEGIDQNPAYYEFLFDQNFRDGPVQDLNLYITERGHKRYGLVDHNDKVADAWSFLLDSAYAQDLSVQDMTGLPHLPAPRGDDASLFERNRYRPKPVLCKMFGAWELLLQAAEESSAPGFRTEPFIYDLVNLGRELLAQLATPASLNFTESTTRSIMDKNEIKNAGIFYIELLRDVDVLVATDKAFLLGPWIESARQWGKSQADCPSAILNASDCEDFYEWNCRTQLTTWNPTPSHSSSVPGGPIDYAAKHWSGLIKDYYGGRATLLLGQALKDANAGRALNQTKLTRLFAQHAYNWTADTKKYPIAPIGCALKVSRSIYNKYKNWFSTCDLMSSSTHVLQEEGSLHESIG
jgi:alpha-N-acetylglucosaminidase